MIKNFSSPVFLMLIIVLMQSACDKGTDEIDIDSGLLWILCSSNATDETIYYVSEIGNDDNSGLSESHAFKSIAKALSTVSPGGTVRILPGVYNESIGIESCGNMDSAITIEGYNGMAVLDGESKMTIGLFFENCNNYMVRKLKIINYTDIGLGFSRGSNLVLTNLEIANNGHRAILKDWEIEGYGIDIEESKDIQISYCDVHHNGPNPQVYPDYLMGTGINTFGNTNVRIWKNKSHHNTGGGILVEDSYSVIIEENEVYNNDLDASIDEWWDGGLWLDGGAGIIIRNNYFHDNKGPGIEISDEEKQKPHSYELHNNICIDNYYGIFIWNFGTNDWPDESIIKKSNNNFSNNSIQDVWIVDWY